MRFLKNTIVLFSALLFIQCKNNNKEIVSSTFIDSLITNYKTPKEIVLNKEEMLFWKSRIKNEDFDMVNRTKYASTLVNRFTLLGDITDVKKADSLLLKVEELFNNKEAGPFLSLTYNAIMQHHFKEANDYLQKAKGIGIKNAENYAATFDVDFELGNIKNASENLEKMEYKNEYGYLFRKSKMEHYNGNLEESITNMQKAGILATANPSLQSTVLSNVGDLYSHQGKFNLAYDSYKKSLQVNSADLHSLMGIGLIALANNNTALAKKIFEFVQTKTKSPDPLYKLILVAQQKQNKVEELKYAKQFEAVVTDSIYGNMYTKYLIQLYTGSLKNPSKAETLAKKELLNRATPQTYSWYAYSLLANNKLNEANTIYKKYISGKPLEALELYYMGKLMEANKKGYNAKEFFKAANENFYDLSPNFARDLKSKLEE